MRGDQPLDGVGIGVPSVVEFATGKVVSSANIPLADVPLREVLGERLGVPVFVDNDATVAALAEAHNESLRMVARDLVILTIGTGVGGGMVLGGRIYRGATGGAGELGHTLIGLDLSHGVPDRGDFPQKGSLEWEAAGHALDRVAREEAEARPDSALGRRLAAGEPVLGPDAVKAARDGDEAALRMCEQWGCRIGIGIANVINTFDPQEVVIGGGGAQAGDLLLDARQARSPSVGPARARRQDDDPARPARHRRGSARGGAARRAGARSWQRAGVAGRCGAINGGERMIVACGFDHAGVSLRDRLLPMIGSMGHEVLDLGTDNTNPIDYPDKALAVGQAVASGAADRGVLLCGSGAGVSVAACKVIGVRACTVHDTYTAHQGVEHDNMNVICLGGRVVGSELAAEIVATFLRATFSGGERHVHRLAKVAEIERTGGVDTNLTAVG